MKSKLTLRLDDEVKEQAKRLATRRGTSVSRIVEDYFRLLLRQDPAEGTGERTGASEKGALEADDLNIVPEDLPPRTRRMLQDVNPVDEPLDLDDDTRVWIDAAHEKHA
ncbi:DUF6364 family protein [Longibacter sp.]|uniref:DUF6364 family protein n=1 Tax=Longibacter sp. TaxID=2045415 RepID=UPI003EB85576